MAVGGCVLCRQDVCCSANKLIFEEVNCLSLTLLSKIEVNYLQHYTGYRRHKPKMSALGIQRQEDCEA